MLVLSPSIFSSNGWLFDDSTSHQHLQQEQQQQPDHFQQDLSSIPGELPPLPQQSNLLQFSFSQQYSFDNLAEAGLLDDQFDHVTPSSKASSGDPNMVKKLNHNASERDRRRKINELYSSLRALLPASDQKKKLSIPVTVSRMLKYIPELQQQVQKLSREKEELLMRVPLEIDTKYDGTSTYYRAGLDRQQKTNNNNVTEPQILADKKQLVSVNRLTEREVAVQISVQKENASQLPEILLTLEKGGFYLVNASTFESFGNDRVFYSLHLQAAEWTNATDCDKLMEKILCLYQKKAWPGIHQEYDQY